MLFYSRSSPVPRSAIIGALIPMQLHCQFSLFHLFQLVVIINCFVTTPVPTWVIYLQPHPFARISGVSWKRGQHTWLVPETDTEVKYTLSKHQLLQCYWRELVWFIGQIGIPGNPAKKYSHSSMILYSPSNRDDQKVQGNEEKVDCASEGKTLSAQQVTKKTKKWDAFVQFTHNQIMELMRDYGKIDLLWLDGGWVQPMTETSPRWGYKPVNQDI